MILRDSSWAVFVSELYAEVCTNTSHNEVLTFGRYGQEVSVLAFLLVFLLP